MSFLSVIWTMSGYDAPFHLSEECSNANIASPRAIVLTSGVGGVLGWALQLVIAYTVTSIPDVLAADQPWAGYCYQILAPPAALAVIALTVCCAFMMGQGCMVAACTSPIICANSSSCDVRICARWMFPTLSNLGACKYDHSHTCQCSLVQCPGWRGTFIVDLCGKCRCWRPFLRRCYRGVCRFYYSYCDSCICRWESIPSWTLEPWEV
jgi:hypothetical protein